MFEDHGIAGPHAPRAPSFRFSERKFLDGGVSSSAFPSLLLRRGILTPLEIDNICGSISNRWGAPLLEIHSAMELTCPHNLADRRDTPWEFVAGSKRGRQEDTVASERHKISYALCMGPVTVPSVPSLATT